MSHQSVLQMLRAKSGYKVSDGCYRISMKTGELVAGFAALGVVFSMRPSDNTGNDMAVAFVERIRLQYTCLTAFTDPTVAGRSLVISGGNNAAGSGGTKLVKPFNKGDSTQASLFQSAGGGDVWIATTGPLGGASAKANTQLAELSLAGLGNAGDMIDKEFIFSGDTTAPCGLSHLDPNFYTSNTDLVISCPAGMDAGGTWELVVEVDTCELPTNFPS